MATQRSILLVEDDEEIRSLLSWILESEGYAVTTAENGADALALVDDFRPDLVMLDGYMPVLDGVGFATALRERGISLPILAMTASRGSAWPNEIGAVASLTKPFDLNHMLAVVARLTAGADGPASPPSESS